MLVLVWGNVSVMLCDWVPVWLRDTHTHMHLPTFQHTLILTHTQTLIHTRRPESLDKGRGGAGVSHISHVMRHTGL